MTIAPIDRSISKVGPDNGASARLSEQRALPRYVLLGEPGIGKSTAFAQEAAAAGTVPVRAADFVEGTRPAGPTLFIDALEEYRIGEDGIDRLRSLVQALAESGYAGWRIACRAISLKPPDARLLTEKLGAYATLQLELLDRFEQRALLAARDEADPSGFIERMHGLGAGALLGNPATLLLLKDTIDAAAVPLDTRAALFGEAARQMSHEVNPDHPERADRPPPPLIEAAAEAASLILLLSGRDDLWMYSTKPPHPHVVTRGDLLPARIDTEALRAAVDTAMFKSDSVTFQPSHRVIAEFLAGRALARAVVPPDPATPVLPIYRALAFCNGDNDRPAPALTGVFAWFVAALAQSRLPDLAAPLLAIDPEAVLLHGDAAALPTAQRLRLLDLVGRGDPWFLAAVRGSSAVGGLAGEDIAPALATILLDPAETVHRQTMVLEALATGRRVSSLADVIETIAVTPSADHYRRRRAVDAWLHIVGDTPGGRRHLLDAIAAETPETAADLRVELAAGLLRAEAIGVEEIRTIIEDYATTGDQVMGYARVLGVALADHPLPALFDRPIAVPSERGVARSFEIRMLVSRALGATIEKTAELDADRLLSWLFNTGIDDEQQVENEVQGAIAHWLDRDAGHEKALFTALHAAVQQGDQRLWRADMDLRRFSGRKPSEALRTAAIEAVEAEADPAALAAAAQLGYQLVQPFDEHEALYWRLFSAIEGKDAAADWFRAMTLSEIPEYQRKRAGKRKDERAAIEAANAKDRALLSGDIDGLRDGSKEAWLGYAGDIYNGYRGNDAPSGTERVTNWLGGDAILIAAIREGWQRLLAARAVSPQLVGAATTRTQWPTSELMIIAWAEWELLDGHALDLNVPLALHLLTHCYAGNDKGDELREIALRRLYADPAGADAIRDFWVGAIEAGADDLPQAQYLDPNQPVVAGAIAALLQSGIAMPPAAAREALELAAVSMPPGELLGIAEAALAAPDPKGARTTWALAAFALDPERHEGLLASDLSGAEGEALFGRLWDGHHGFLLAAAADKTVARSEALIRHVGPGQQPRRGGQKVHKLSELVAGALVQLAQAATLEASEALARLIAEPSLAHWRETLRHHQEEQKRVCREARFLPPPPEAVASALAAGPPANAADLRALVHHVIEELARDIRDGDTSPWRSFWNRPTRGTNGPKVENDCRDILTDRLRDRLERYGIPVKRMTTEARSANDRRADMFLIGDGAARLPVEVKRHWNKELWTAIDDQLVDYARSGDSSGHGIYLIFWFGTQWALPRLPDGGPLPETPQALQALLIERMPATLRETIAVVVLDVSEPPSRDKPKPKPKAKGKPEPRLKPGSTARATAMPTAKVAKDAKASATPARRTKPAAVKAPVKSPRDSAKTAAPATRKR